jgi:hypothetical protein
MVGSAVLLVGALASQFTASPAPPAPTSLAARLHPSSWAMNVPSAWLAAPAPRLRDGDVLDILGVKQGDHAYSVPIAYAVTVVSSDERGIVLDLDDDDASAIAIARGAGLLLVPLLRSVR